MMVFCDPQDRIRTHNGNAYSTWIWAITPIDAEKQYMQYRAVRDAGGMECRLQGDDLTMGTSTLQDATARIEILWYEMRRG